MKALIITAGLILTAATVMGQQPTEERPYLSSTAMHYNVNLAKAGKNFLAGLNSNNDGVVESSIAQVAHLRALLPLADLSDIEAAVSALSSTGRTPAIRYKAYLASMVFANPGMFNEQTAVDYSNADEFFNALSVRLQQTLLGYNGK